MRDLLRVGWAVAALGLASTALAQGKPFSADMVQTASGEAAEQMKKMAAQMGREMPTTMTWKIYRSGTRMRLDMTSGPQQAIAITDLASSDGKGWMLQPKDKTYLEYANRLEAKEQAEMLQFLKTGGDLCQLKIKYPTCRKLQAEVVGGRPCQSYEVAPKSGEKETLCVDDGLRFPIREVKRSQTMELKNVVEAAQAASLFEIPAGYRKTGK